MSFDIFTSAAASDLALNFLIALDLSSLVLCPHDLRLEPAAILQLIAKLGEDGVFDPQAVSVLVAAFDSAWASVQSSGAPFAEERYQEAAREILAKAIIRAAKAGERNEGRLVDVALLELSKATLRRRPPDAK
jgi:hypothetical protein